ncbi:hypothetical protein [Methanobrevibacter sp.]|uniref:hypothetical protein n=1 Tax=Methanobrevibacter sp. TaxID=66852 RepID=UPI003890BF2F
MLVPNTFKTTIKIVKDNDLIKIHHLSLDGRKIKAKTSINKLTSFTTSLSLTSPIRKVNPDYATFGSF